MKLNFWKSGKTGGDFSGSCSGLVPAGARGSGQCAFTLVELLVAMAITLLVIVVMVSIMNGTSTLWKQGIVHDDRRSAALAVFERMAQDLRASAQPTDFSGPTLQMVISSTSASGPLSSLSGTYQLPQAIFWQAASGRMVALSSGAAISGTNGGNGDLAVIGYFVQWTANSNGTTTPKLCRLFIDPSSPAYGVYPVSGAASAVYSGTTTSGASTWTSTITDALLSGSYGAPATQATGYQGELAENVLGLWVQALDQQGQPITQYPVYSGSNPITSGSATFPSGQFDSTKGYISSVLYQSGTYAPTTATTYSTSVFLSGSSSPGTVIVGGTTPTYWEPPVAANKGSLPAAIEVAIVTVDSRTALLLAGTERPVLQSGSFSLWSNVNAFYNGLPPLIRHGAEIHSTIINLADGPR